MNVEVRHTVTTNKQNGKPRSYKETRHKLKNKQKQSQSTGKARSDGDRQSLLYRMRPAGREDAQGCQEAAAKARACPGRRGERVGIPIWLFLYGP